MECKGIIPGELCKSYPDGFTVRHMTRNEAGIIIGWYSDICATSCDLEVAFDALGTELQAFVGVLEDRIVASAVRTPVSDNILYGSLFYVEEQQRKFGLGQRIRDEAAGQHVEGRIVCIDAHEELMPMNKRRGYSDAFELVHFTGQVSEGLISRRANDVDIIPFSDSLFESLLAYDDGCFVTSGSHQRRKLMELWVRIPGGRTVVAVKSGTSDIIGFVCRRPAAKACRNHVIGPLYADNPEVASNLMSAITDDIPQQHIWMSVCTFNLEALSLVASLKLQEHIHMRRMHLNGQLEPPNNKVFAITSIDICGF